MLPLLVLNQYKIKIPNFMEYGTFFTEVKTLHQKHYTPMIVKHLCLIKILSKYNLLFLLKYPLMRSF